MSSELAVVENAGVLMRKATDVAGVCREIVVKTAQPIQGRKYVRCEGWQAIANAFGCVASARDVEVIEGGIRAIGEVRRVSDGAVVATGEGFVGDDEKTWASRPLFARRAMAQTRAISRACRSAFAFVVTLIDGNLSTTPAEEMEGVIDVQATQVVKAAAPAPSRTAQLKAKVAQRVQEEPPPPGDEDAPPTQADVINVVLAPVEDVIIPFGKLKGQPLSAASKRDLEWLEKVFAESVADPAKEKFRAKNEGMLDAIRSEIAGRKP